jgi:hypothetical protein
VLVLDDDAAARDWLQAAVRQAFPDAELVAAGSLRDARVALRTMSPTWPWSTSTCPTAAASR